jgi:ABC-type Fe3+ transport system permease subunit
MVRWILIHTLVIVLILLLGASPLLSALIAGTIAEANGCTLHEGFVNPCVINGTDWGETLYTMGVLAWLSLATIPIALMAALLYLVIVIIVALILRSRRQRATQESTPSTN